MCNLTCYDNEKVMRHEAQWKRRKNIFCFGWFGGNWVGGGGEISNLGPFKSVSFHVGFNYLSISLIFLLQSLELWNISENKTDFVWL